MIEYLSCQGDEEFGGEWVMSEPGGLPRHPVHHPAVSSPQACLYGSLHVSWQRALSVRLQQDRCYAELQVKIFFLFYENAKRRPYE